MKNTLRKLIRKNNGYTGVDLSVSAIIITISVALIATFVYNIYISGEGLKRNVVATDYAIIILETIESTDYEDVTFKEDTSLKKILDNILGDINGKINTTTNTYTGNAKNYNIDVKIENYNEKFQTDEKEDYIKIITVSISYNLGKKSNNEPNTEILEIKTLKTIN